MAADLRDLSVDRVGALAFSRIDRSINFSRPRQGILPEIIAGLKEILLRVESGEDLSKIASSLEGCTLKDASFQVR